MNAINTRNVISRFSRYAPCALRYANGKDQINQMNKPSALYILSVHGMIEPDVNLEVTNAI
jgi:hypothetical protein